jgi:hypothetical protein
MCDTGDDDGDDNGDDEGVLSVTIMQQHQCNTPAEFVIGHASQHGGDDGTPTRAGDHLQYVGSIIH